MYLVYNVRNGNWWEVQHDVVTGCVPAAFALPESLLPCKSQSGSMSYNSALMVWFD